MQKGGIPVDQSIKLDTAFEKNFRDMEAKIKSLPKGGKVGLQNYQYVASEDDFGGLLSPKNEIMKKEGVNLCMPADGPPVVKD